MQSDIQQWTIEPQSHLFFDIDDTLNAHRLGLNEAIIEKLNKLTQQGKTVALLTNCSAARAQAHLSQLGHDSKIELWPVGRKPDYIWLTEAIAQRGWDPKDCAMFGDRPTMDLYVAYKASFGSRVWVKAWGINRPWRNPLQWIQNIEWFLLA
jgi:ribonucleotide monophosphatase NagD (HAD superfamily)